MNEKKSRIFTTHNFPNATIVIGKINAQNDDYIILASILLTVFISWSLRDSYIN